ncbi:MAG TPA: hypothetical protein VKI64_01940 [Acidimicrobiales bacterium]|nr:hypothetical protein [Acidimicrobiales bacterium]
MLPTLAASAPSTTGAVASSATSATGEDTRPPPGALNPDVTQADIGSTVCVRGWTATVRPPAAYTGALKRQQIAARHLPDTNPADYEEDHAIPLELGGSPRDPDNLWPEPLAAARRADVREGELRDEVCSGRITLRVAQAALLEFKRQFG